jgi:hypothetical protein
MAGPYVVRAMGEARKLGGLTEMVEEALDGIAYPKSCPPGLTVGGTPYQPSRTCPYINRFYNWRMNGIESTSSASAADGPVACTPATVSRDDAPAERAYGHRWLAMVESGKPKSLK